jgi:hypothetical protein
VRQQQQHKQQPMMQREAPAPQRQQPLPPQQPPSLAPLAAGARQAQELPQHRRAQQPTSYAPPARDRPLYQPEREMPSEVPPAGERRMSASAQAALAAASSTVCSCASLSLAQTLRCPTQFRADDISIDDAPLHSCLHSSYFSCTPV